MIMMQWLPYYLRNRQAGGDLNIYVLGGSMTRRVRCDNLMIDGVQLPSDECRWSARLRDWARKRYTASQITVSNRAINACNSICQLSSLAQSLPRDHPANIVLLDMAVNDVMVNVAVALVDN
jgi:hypothetical protein